MIAAEALAMLVATGVQAEAVVRSAAEALDKDWQRHMELLTTESTREGALKAQAALEALAPYRALLGACVATWDGPDEGTSDVVRIGGAS